MARQPDTEKDDASPARKRIQHFIDLSAEETDFFETIQRSTINIERGDVVFEHGENLTHCFAVRRGWAIACRYTTGGRRQILSVYLPGDFIGVHVNFVQSTMFTLEALTTLEIAMIEPMRLIELYQRFPVLAGGLDWSAARQTKILAEHNVSLGARTAEERILHFYLEIWCRLMMIGEASSDGFTMRLTQEQIGDVLGISTVHCNKSIAKLRKRGVIDINDRWVSFPKLSEALKLADFDASFLETFRHVSAIGKEHSVFHQIINGIVSPASNAK